MALTGRVLAVGLTLWAVWHFARQLAADDWRAWLWESWRFVKQIFVLLVAGRVRRGHGAPGDPARMDPDPGRQQHPAGQRRGVVFGVFMYFPTLVEVPVARMFLDLGMHPGPLLAYLMADPELSLQSMLMVAAVIGRTKTFSLCGHGGGVQRRRRPDLRRLGGRLGLDAAGSWRWRFIAGSHGGSLAWLRHRQRATAPLSLTHAHRRSNHVDRQNPGIWLRQLQEARSRGARGRQRAPDLQAEFVKVTDMKAIMAYDLLSTPGLVINEKLVSSGRIPTVAEVQKWLVV